MKTYKYEETVRFTVVVKANTEEEARENAVEFVEGILNAADKVESDPKVKRWEMDTTDHFIEEI